MPEDRWLKIAERVRTSHPELNVAQRICKVGGELLDSESLGLALVIDKSFSPIASSDDLATLLDEEQFALGDGPTFEAQASAAPVIVDDIREHSFSKKWPAFAPVAQKHDIRGIFAFPLRIGSAYIGVLTAYRRKAGPLSSEQYSDGLFLASLATAELVRRQAGAKDDELADVFEIGLYDKSALQIAAGMVAEYLDCTIVEALVRIRARAFADDRPVTAIAQAILAKELVIEK